MRNDHQVFIKRCKETFGMMMIGDGIVALLEPRRHVDLWADGPRIWKCMMKPFISRPGLTRIVAGLELGLGLWLSSRQEAPSASTWKFWKGKQ